MTARSRNKLQAATEQMAGVLMEARAVLDQWRGRVADATAELARLDALSGDDLLDDPEKAAQWPVRAREARDAVAVAQRAAEAQERRVEAAERAYLAAEAALLEEVEVVPARRALEEHQARTRELLAQLEAHDGPYVPQARALRAEHDRRLGPMPAVTLPKSSPLERASALAVVRHRLLEAMAAGEDPAGEGGRVFGDEDAYPACVRPGGLVPAPLYAGRVESSRARVEDLEAAAVELRGEVEDLESQGFREGWTEEQVAEATARRRQRLEEIPVELEAAQADLAALAG